MKLQTKKLAKMTVAGLCVLGLSLVYLRAGPTPFTLPALPEATPPSADTSYTEDAQKSAAGNPAGGFVAANDERPDSQPYHHDTTLARAILKQQFSGATSTAAGGQTSHKITRKPAERLVVINNKEYPLRTYKPLLTPNDPSASQWWVGNAKLNETWDIPAGGHQTILAVIDTGFGLNHEEFAGRLYTSTGESGSASSEQPSQLNCTDRGLALDATCNLIDDDYDGTIDNDFEQYYPAYYENPSRLNCTDQGIALSRTCNRIDDDGNGFTDDVSGWDFANNDNSSQAGELNPYGSGTTHGTRVAGVAAATGNNAKGIAGADWQTKILPIQALDDDSYGDTLGVGRSILYAASQGADVISLSLGSELPDDYVREAIQIATAAGSVVVAASGNDGCDCISYPANYQEVVAVGALDTNSLPTSFSSYGANLDILAPGTQITTSSWSASNGTTGYASNVAGTSFATPLVSGLLTRMLGSQPGATPLQLIAALTENTNRLTLPATVSRSSQLGYGTLDGFKASTRMVTPQNDTLLYQFSPISKGATLTPGTPAEVTANYAVRKCAEGVAGTTPMYELTKANSHFFSISQVEVWLAQRAGYHAALFAEACLQQPHDSASIVRPLNVFKEFRNILHERVP